MSRISPVEFVKTLLAMLKEIPEGLLESREHREQGYKIKVEPAKVGSDHWIDVEVEFENMSKETVEKALKRASDLANKLDEKIIEIFKTKGRNN